MININFILIIIITIYAVFKLIRVLADINSVEHAKSWISVDANVIDNRIKTIEGKFFKKIKEDKIFFYAKYIVDDVWYGSSSISLLDNNKSLIRGVMKQLINKDTCKMYYNPDKPHESVLIDPARITFWLEYLKLTLLTTFILVLIFL